MMDETRALVAASRRLRRAAASKLCVTDQRATNALQHSKARARLSNEAREARRLANAEQHAQFHTLETVEQREERRLANTTRNVEHRARIAREDGIQVARLVGLRDIHALLANPNVQREILGRISQKCVFCGTLFWVEERTGGSARRPQYQSVVPRAKF